MNEAQTIKTFALRLTENADDLLRNAYNYRGDLSAQVATILETVSLQKIAIVKFPTGRAAQELEAKDRPTKKTSIRLSVALYEEVQSVAEKRGTSVNVMLNSAIIAALAKL